MKKRKLRKVCYEVFYADDGTRTEKPVAEVSMLVCADNWDEWKAAQETVFEAGRKMAAEARDRGFCCYLSGRRIRACWSNFIRCCDCCGTPYEAPDGQSRYCPDCGRGGAQKIQAAKRKAKRQAALTDRPCQHCGELFTPKRKDAKFCGNACRQANFRKK